MLTYLNAQCKRVAVTDDKIIKQWHKVNDILSSLDDDTFQDYIEMIGNYVWECDTAERKRAYNKLYRVAKKLGITVNDLVLWDCIE
jgi:hypothetical protein